MVYKGSTRRAFSSFVDITYFCSGDFENKYCVFLQQAFFDKCLYLFGRFTFVYIWIICNYFALRVLLPKTD